MKNIDYSLYLVTQHLNSPEAFQNLKEALDGGITCVQFRDKTLHDNTFIALGKKLLSLLRPYRVPLVINDRVHCVEAIGAQGLHLGQSDMAPQSARAILGNDAIIGLSVETVEQAQKALDQHYPIDYLAASTVFETNSKHDTATPLGLEGLQAIIRLSTLPVIAIGGIHFNNIDAVLKQGVSGVAMISAILSAKNILTTTQTFKGMLDKNANSLSTH